MCRPVWRIFRDYSRKDTSVSPIFILKQPYIIKLSSKKNKWSNLKISIDISRNYDII